MSDKVVNLDEKRKEKKKVLETKDESALTFEEIAERNRKNKERVEKERLSANKSVLRSYRLKT